MPRSLISYGEKKIQEKHLESNRIFSFILTYREKEYDSVTWADIPLFAGWFFHPATE